MAKKVVNIGIMSLENYKDRTMAIVRGEYKPGKNEPKIWFESFKVLGEVLNNGNQELLKTIIKHKPQSLKELAELSGRHTSNLSRSLKTMERIGLVELTRNGRKVRPTVVATDFRIEFGIYS